MFGLRSCVVFITAASFLYFIVAFAVVLTFSSVVAVPNPVRDEVHVGSGFSGCGLTSRIGFPSIPTGAGDDFWIELLNSEMDETVARLLLCCPIALAAISYFWKFLQYRRRYTRAGVRELTEQANIITNEYKHVLLRLSKAKLLLKSVKKYRRGPISSKVKRAGRNQRRRRATGATWGDRKNSLCSANVSTNTCKRRSRYLDSGMNTGCKGDEPHLSAGNLPVPYTACIPDLLMPNDDKNYETMDQISPGKHSSEEEGNDLRRVSNRNNAWSENVQSECPDFKQILTVTATSTPKPKSPALLMGNDSADTPSLNGCSDNGCVGLHLLERLSNDRVSPIPSREARTGEECRLGVSHFMQERDFPSTENRGEAVRQLLAPTDHQGIATSTLPTNPPKRSTSDTPSGSLGNDDLVVLYRDASLHNAQNQYASLTERKMKELGFPSPSSEVECGSATSQRTSSTDSFWPGSSDSSSCNVAFSDDEAGCREAANYCASTSSGEGNDDGISWPNVSETRARRVVQEEISDDGVPVKKFARPGAAMMNRLESNRNHAALKGPQPIAGCPQTSSESAEVDSSSASVPSSPMSNAYTNSSEMAALGMRHTQPQSDDSYISTPASESVDSEFVASHNSPSVSTGATDSSDFEIDFRDGRSDSDAVICTDGRLITPSASPCPNSNTVPPIRIPTGSVTSTGTSPGGWITEHDSVDERPLRYGLTPGEIESSKRAASKSPLTPGNPSSVSILKTNEDHPSGSASDGICAPIHYPIGYITPYACELLKNDGSSDVSLSRTAEEISSTVGNCGQMSVNQIRDELYTMENRERENLKKEMENAKHLVMKDLNEERDMIIRQIKEKEEKAKSSFRAKLVNCFRPRRRVLNQLRERLKAVEIATAEIKRRSDVWNDTLQQVEEEKRAKERSRCHANVDRIRQYEQAIVVCTQRAMALRKVFQGKSGERTREEPHCYDCLIGRHPRLGASPKPRSYKRFHDDVEPRVHTPLLCEGDGFPTTCPIVKSINSRYEALNMTEYVPLDVKVLRISKMQKRLQWDLFRRPYLIDGQLPRC